LLQRADLFYSVSWTTREPRPGERDGTDYRFVDRAQFLGELRSQGFLEHAEFVGHLYGTPRAPVAAALAQGRDVLLEIEVQGAAQVAAHFPQAVLIFILPPNLEELRRRLIRRGTEASERIEQRLARAAEELRSFADFHYLVINDQVERAADDLVAIVRAEHLRSRRYQPKTSAPAPNSPL
jgi:guanylate kinase